MVVSSTNLRYPTFQGTSDQAKVSVKKMQQGLMQPRVVEDNQLNFVSLQHVNRSGTESSFSISRFRQPEERRIQTGSYLTSLIEVLYPNATATEAQQDIKATFADYLNGTVEREGHNKESGDISAERLLTYLKELQLARLDAEAAEAGSRAESSPFANDVPQKIEGPLDVFLESKEIIIESHKLLGEGTFGIVFPAQVQGERGKYVYKKEKQGIPSHALTGRSSSFWREGDCAAARLHDLSHIPKPLFFIFYLCLADQSEEIHYVPANHVKAFGMKLPQGTTVFLEGQLMERAPGESLDKMIQKNGGFYDFIQGTQFKNIVRGLFDIVQKLQGHNLVHRDIKPENIFYHAQTGEVTLLDFGSATKLRKKEKIDDGSHLNSPTSKIIRGALQYVSPRVMQEQAYGSEVDLFSFAMTLLELVSPKDVFNFACQRFPNRKQGDTTDHLFATCPPREYLDRFLEVISDKQPQQNSNSLPTLPSFLSSLFGASGSSDGLSSARVRAQSWHHAPAHENSKLARILNRNSAVKQIIDLAFQASGGGDEGTVAYEQLKALPYFSKDSSPAASSTYFDDASR